MTSKSLFVCTLAVLIFAVPPAFAKKDTPLKPTKQSLGDLTCSTDQIAKFDGSAWVCAEDDDTQDGDTLAGLGCAAGKIAKSDGSVGWSCTADETGGSDSQVVVRDAYGNQFGKVIFAVGDSADIAYEVAGKKLHLQVRAVLVHPVNGNVVRAGEIRPPNAKFAAGYSTPTCTDEWWKTEQFTPGLSFYSGFDYVSLRYSDAGLFVDIVEPIPPIQTITFAYQINRLSGVCEPHPNPFDLDVYSGVTVFASDIFAGISAPFTLETQ